MKTIAQSLPARLLFGVVAGVLAGLVANETVMQVILTVKNLMGSLISFCVPLIVIGFIAPSITRLRGNASRMLVLALILAYASSVCAAFMSMTAGYAIIPHLSIVSSAEGLRKLPDLLFHLEIAPVMSVMSALVFSVLIGLAAAWTRAETVTRILEEFRQIVLAVVTRIVIPVLPFFIACTFCGLSYEGSVTKQFPVFVAVILIVMAGHYIWLAVLYGLAGAYSGANPWEVLRHYGPRINAPFFWKEAVDKSKEGIKIPQRDDCQTCRVRRMTSLEKEWKISGMKVSGSHAVIFLRTRRL